MVDVVVECDEAVLLIEEPRVIVDGFDLDSVYAQSFTELVASSQGVHQKKPPESTTLRFQCNREPCQKHDGNWVAR
jgi:hypothetical protein